MRLRDRWIPGYIGIYEINQYGGIYSYLSGRYLKPGLSSKGYYRVCLTKREAADAYKFAAIKHHKEFANYE